MKKVKDVFKQMPVGALEVFIKTPYTTIYLPKTQIENLDPGIANLKVKTTEIEDEMLTISVSD